MKVLLFILLGCMAATVLGHSWLDCADWRFNNPSQKKYKDSEGSCYGYARMYPAGSRAYGTYDGFQWYRHYVQNPNWKTNPASSLSDNAPVCRPYNANDGSDERRKTPETLAYAPNADKDGKAVGPMTVTSSGSELCWRWPAKNHAGHVNDASMVHVYWAPTAGSDPSQQVMLQNEVAQLRYRNCPEPGVASPATDQTGVGSDRMPCGGCFTVPARAAGTYLVQWRWELNRGEVYSSCADIKIVAGQTPPPPATVPDVDPVTPDIKISASITIRIPKKSSDIDIALFVGELAKILDIPTSAIESVQVQLDQSTDVPPSTVIFFVLTNLGGVDPVSKAKQLKTMAQTADPRLAATENLSGMEIVTVESGSNSLTVVPAVVAVLSFVAAFF